MSRLIAATVLVVALTAACCGDYEESAADLVRETKEAAQAAGDFIADQIDTYRGAMTEKLDELGPRVEALNQRAVGMSAQARANWKVQVANLESRRAELALRLEEIQGSSGEAWKDIKEGLDKAWDELELAFEKAATRFDKEAVPEEG
jgi:hypothetical protein